METISVSARPEDDGTAVIVSLDRRGTLGLVTVSSVVAMFFTVLFAGSALYPESAALGIGGAVVGVGGILAIARGFWAATTRSARERMSTIVDAVTGTLAKPVSGDRPATVANEVRDDAQH